MNEFKLGIFAFGLLAILGCGSDSPETPSDGTDASTTNNITLYNKLALTPLNTLTSIDLSENIKGDNTRLEAISSTDVGQCFSEVISDKSVAVEMYDLGRCNYTYSVINDRDDKAQANLTLVSGASTENVVLPSLSIALIKSNALETQMHEIDLVDAHSGVELSDFSLDQEELSATSEGNAIALSNLAIGSTDLSIEFEIPKIEGWHKIEYTLINQVENKAMIGEIFVSIANEINHPPVIKPIYFERNVQNQTVKNKLTVESGDSLIVDLKDIDCIDPKTTSEETCLSIIDPDAHRWQLTHVSTLANNDVKLAANTMLNTAFEFRSTVPGFHDITYIVSDNEGASSMGMVQIFVHDKNYGEPRNWDDIAYKNKDSFDNDYREVSRYCKNLDTAASFTCHSAPLTLIETVKFNNKFHDDNGTYVSLWTYPEAQSFCTGDGNSPTSLKLPTKEDLTLLYKTYIDTAANPDFSHFKREFLLWPKKKPYMLEDGRLFSLATGLITESVNGTGYLSCFAKGDNLLHMEVGSEK